MRARRLLVATLLGLGLCAPIASAQVRYPVGRLVLGFTDTSRQVTFPGRPPQARPLLTIIRYPAAAGQLGTELPRARPATGRFPLIVFAHGFNITPAPYSALLDYWASAGYVVAAPVFPLTNARAPGGPDESDLINQPADLSVVITRMLSISATRHDILRGRIAGNEIAVAGQSDGGSTALAAAYNRHDLDPRLAAAVVLSGARIPGLAGYAFGDRTPPLLAVQGTADRSNAPASTYSYFRRIRAPKFLLSLLGAGHLPPYTNEQPQLGIVEQVSTAFLDRYLKRRSGAAARMSAAGTVPGVARLSTAAPTPLRPRSAVRRLSDTPHGSTVTP